MCMVCRTLLAASSSSSSLTTSSTKMEKLLLLQSSQNNKIMIFHIPSEQPKAIAPCKILCELMCLSSSTTVSMMHLNNNKNVLSDHQTQGNSGKEYLKVSKLAYMPRLLLLGLWHHSVSHNYMSGKRGERGVCVSGSNLIGTPLIVICL